MAVLRLAMGLLPLLGLPVPSLRFPVNPEHPLASALFGTIGLAPPAPAAHEEARSAEAAVDLYEKQKRPPTLRTVGSRDKIEWFVGLRSFRSSSSKPEA